MRILMDVEHLGPEDGVAVQTLQVARGLIERGNQVSLIFQNDGPYRQLYEAAGAALTQVRSLGFDTRKPWTMARSFPAAVMAGVREKPDVVYDSLLWTLPWANAVAALCRVPVVSHVHGFGPDEHLSAAFRWPLRRSRRVISVSDFYREKVEKEGVEPSKVCVVHNGVDPASYPLPLESQRAVAREQFGVAATSFVVLFYGRVDPSKGIDVLIDAALALSRDRPDIGLELVIAGLSRDPAYLSGLRTKAGSLTCHWLPLQADVVRLLHTADVVAVPSIWDEPFARVVIEGLSAGLPVVASRVGGIPEILSGPLSRYLVERADPIALAATLAAQVDWRSSDPTLAERHRSHVRELFSLDRMMDGIEAQLAAATQK
jgi:glycosyltransferase involved in cell wall biosynthesis